MNGSKLPLNVLSSEHFNRLQACIRRTLNTTAARQAYAQIIDGAPNEEAHRSNANIRNLFEETSEEAFRVFDAYHDAFTTDILSFDSKAYQDAELESRPFLLRLLELVVVACHDIAVMLYSTMDGGLRPQALVACQPTPGVDPTWFVQVPLPPTVFAYDNYVNVKAYPNSVADCVGYWVEFEIFGGVVVFDRNASGTEHESAYIHPGGNWWVAQLSDTQIWDLLHPVDSAGVDGEPNLPWVGQRGQRRIDPFDSLAMGIYRDEYERVPSLRRRHVRQAEDFPELMDAANEARAAWEAQWGPI